MTYAGVGDIIWGMKRLRKVLTKKNIAIGIFILVLGYMALVVGYNLRESELQSSTPTDTPVTEVEEPQVDPLYELWTLTNQARTVAGLGTLELSQVLNEGAQAKCADMQKKNYWEHGDVTGFFKINAEQRGENLSKDYTYAKDAFEGWMNSQTHKENILRPEYTMVGFAKCDGPQSNLIVQHFSTPAY